MLEENAIRNDTARNDTARNDTALAGGCRLLVVTLLLLMTVASAPASAGIHLQDWGTRIDTVGNRFVLKFGGAAVLDRETQLVWEQSPDTAYTSWALAREECLSRTVGDRKGWRLPSVHELASLVDPTQLGVSLPTDHPFSNVETEQYWSSSTDADDPTQAWSVRFLQAGSTSTFGKFNGLYVWCVRGGSPGPDAY